MSDTVLRDVRLLMVSIDAPPRRGGVASFTRHCGEEFAKRCDHAVFFGPGSSVDRRAGTFDVEAIADGITGRRPLTGKEYYKSAKSLEKRISRIVLKRNINKIIMFHPFFYGVPVANVARNLGVTFDVVVHGTELTSQFPEALEASTDLGPRPVDGRPLQLLTTLRNAARIHANSAFTASLASRIALRSDVAVCGCGVSSRDFEAGVRSWNLTLNEKRAKRSQMNCKWADKAMIAFVGRLVPHKKIETAVQLLLSFPAILVIVGEGASRARISHFAEEIGVRDRVFFLGPLDDAKRDEIVAVADFVVMPSQFDLETGGYEGFGLTMIEAPVLGTISIGTGNEGLSEPIYEHGVGYRGLAQIDEMSATVSLMSYLTENEERYRKKVEEDRSIIKRELLWERVVNRISGGWFDG